MGTLAERINYALDQLDDGSQAALARACGISTASVNNWFSGETKSLKGENLLKAAAYLRVNPTWLASGKGVMRSDANLANTEPGPDIKGCVPLISWVQAGAWAEIIDNFTPGNAEEWLPCPVAHGERTYVLRVRGESMFNPHGRPSFADGDLIFVDPDRAADHGALVIVRLDEAKEATFKRLIVEGDYRYLKALNPAWPEPMIQVNGHATICGVVIAKMEKL